VIPRAILDLTQLDDDRFFEEVAQGMRLCLRNALQLWRDAKLLSKRRRAQGFQIIKLLVEEEAAKFHILLDAVRCPRSRPDDFSRHLKCFADHLSRGLYTEYYQWTEMPLTEAVTYIDRERRTLYLDGPEGVEWIFRNAIECRREEAIYVDYIARDELRAEHDWHCPNPRLLDMYRLVSTPTVLRVAKALHHTGFSRPEAIRIVAQIWRNAQAPETLTWEQVEDLNLQTLNRLQEANLVGHATQATQRTIVNEWRPPLYPLNLRKLDVNPAKLREVQDQWVPDYY
jgi:AbiV family abortive infection protein